MRGKFLLTSFLCGTKHIYGTISWQVGNTSQKLTKQLLRPFKPTASRLLARVKQIWFDATQRAWSERYG